MHAKGNGDWVRPAPIAKAWGSGLTAITWSSSGWCKWLKAASQAATSSEPAASELWLSDLLNPINIFESADGRSEDWDEPLEIIEDADAELASEPWAVSFQIDKMVNRLALIGSNTRNLWKTLNAII